MITKRIHWTISMALMSLFAVAQEPAARLAVIPLIASDSHHRPANLNVDSLVVTDQNTKVAGATLVRGADLPLKLGLLIDTSNSQRSADLNEVLKAANQFASEAIHGDDDRVFILPFATFSQATDWLTREQLPKIQLKLKLGGATALYDAVAAACKGRMGLIAQERPAARRVLVLVSDGDDNQSHITLEAAASEALRSGTVIFTINTDLTGMPHKGSKALKVLAEMTGGESFNEVGGREIPKVFDAIQQMLGGMYYLTFVPPDPSRGGFHEIEVQRASKEKFKLSYARKYFWEQ